MKMNLTLEKVKERKRLMMTSWLTLTRKKLKIDRSR